MSRLQSFVIRELEPDLEIIHISYSLDGFHYKLKNNNSLNIKEILIVNPQIINYLISYHFNKKYKKILESYMNALQEESSDESSNGLLIILDEIARLRSILIRKYHTFLTKKKEEQLLKKLKILENEIRSKIIDLRLIKEQELVNNINIEEKGKSR